MSGRVGSGRVGSSRVESSRVASSQFDVDAFSLMKRQSSYTNVWNYSDVNICETMCRVSRHVRFLPVA